MAQASLHESPETVPCSQGDLSSGDPALLPSNVIARGEDGPPPQAETFYEADMQQDRLSCAWWLRSAIFLVTCCALLSTGASIAGGLILYWEGLASIERTVKEVSEAEAMLVAQELNASFATAEAHARAILLLVRYTAPGLSTLDELFAFSSAASVAALAADSRLWGLSLFVVPARASAADPGGSIYVYWHDLLRNGTRLYATSSYDPSHWDRGCSGRRCMWARKIDLATGVRGSPLYNYSVDSFVNTFNDPGGAFAVQQQGWEAAGAAWWRPPTVWTSTDGSQWSYMTRTAVQPVLGLPVLAGLKVFAQTHVLFERWSDTLRLRSTEITGQLVLVNLGLGMQSMVLARSDAVSIIRPGCNRSEVQVQGVLNRCIMKLEDMEPTVRQAAVEVNSTAPGTFLRREVGGAMHWLRRLVVHRMEALDQMDEPNLIWLRPVASVNDDLERSRNLFLVFIAVVAAIDAVVISFEVVLIGRPLSLLRQAIAPVDCMEISEAQRRLRRYRPCRVVFEVGMLVHSVERMLNNLAEYRSYLPQALLQSLDSGFLWYPQEPPTGTVAICFTDIVNSTKLWEAEPSVMNVVMELHNEVVRDAIRKFEGYEVKTIGDAFMVSFRSAVKALLFAVRVHEDLLSTVWPDAHEFHAVPTWPRQEGPDGTPVWGGVVVRIGIGYGDLIAEVNQITDRTDYRGRECNLAARLENSAPVGLVNISDACFKEVQGDGLPRGIDFYSTESDLKGIGSVTSHVAASHKLRHRVTAWRDGLDLSARNASPAQNPLDTISLGIGDRRASRVSGMSAESSFQRQQSSCSSSTMTRSVSGRIHPRLLGGTRLDQTVASVAVVNGLDGSSQHSHDPFAEPHVTHVALGMREVMMRNVDWMVASCSRTQGKVSTLMGSSAQVSWNVIYPCATYEIMSLRFADLVLGDRSSLRKPVVGVSTGQVHHGAVGPARQRYHVIVGLVPRAADSLASVAADLGAGCLAIYFPDTPSSVLRVLRPIDVWGLPLQDDSRTRRTVTVEQLDPAAVRAGALGEADALDCLVADAGPKSAHAAGLTELTDKMAAYRKVFFDAVSGDAAALMVISQMAAGDDVLTAVAAALHSPRHQAIAGGQYFRVAAPFVQWRRCMPGDPRGASLPSPGAGDCEPSPPLGSTPCGLDSMPTSEVSPGGGHIP
eukprot:TRINITY_DN10118_c0_g1_i1.p1 TRINITY_DN10118_c0_g1~~TRINITY_DN10118_c0_g1_i1.p1  ORF type:complete len:1165 (+),score=185.18 TRINITY_DN10118_c0_g1_i1:117-3611(+)